jgi:Profilin
VQASGLHLAGEKYFVIMANEKSLYGKKVCAFYAHVSHPPDMPIPVRIILNQGTPNAKVYLLSYRARKAS